MSGIALGVRSWKSAAGLAESKGDEEGATDREPSFECAYDKGFKFWDEQAEDWVIE